MENANRLTPHLKAPVDRAEERDDDGAVLDLEELGVLQHGEGRLRVVAVVDCRPSAKEERQKSAQA